MNIMKKTKILSLKAFASIFSNILFDQPKSFIEKNRQQLLLENNVVAEFYNHTTNMYTGIDGVLNFAPFTEVIPGFSWILTFAYPEKYKKQIKFVFDKQKEMRNILWRNVDFSSCVRVLDFGCGYGADLINLAQKYEHLQLSGYTISNKQAEIANQEIYKLNLQDRITIFNRDSSSDDFPDQYDIIFGFEVASYIKNKRVLISNVNNHMKNRGLLILADFIANLAFPIEHEKTSSYIITKEQWIDLLSQNYLKVIDCIDVSHEIGNFLYDPNFQENLNHIPKISQNENVKSCMQAYNNLGKMLRKGLVSYVLLTAQKQSDFSTNEIYKLNQKSLIEIADYSNFIKNF